MVGSVDDEAVCGHAGFAGQRRRRLSRVQEYAAYLDGFADPAEDAGQPQRAVGAEGPGGQVAGAEAHEWLVRS